MAGKARIRINRLHHNLRLTRPIVILAVGVLLPVLLSSSVGIIALVLGKSTLDLILGVLSVSLAAAAIGSGIIVTVLLGRRARTARLQSDLLGNVTHELKTPLAAIRLYAQTLQMGLVDQDPELSKKCVDTIMRESDWLGAMIERLLTWRTAAKDRDNLDFVDVPIDRILEKTADRFSSMLPPEGVDFQTRIKTSLPVRHDRSGIGSVVINLLTNAYKYTGAEKVISLTAEDLDGWVEIRIRDNGTGIPGKELKKIFEPFHRVEKQRNSVAGTGLGLAIVDFFVTAHSGSISVDSTPGLGSSFTITLPALAGEDKAT